MRVIAPQKNVLNHSKPGPGWKKNPLVLKCVNNLQVQKVRKKEESKMCVYVHVYNICVFTYTHARATCNFAVFL